MKETNWAQPQHEAIKDQRISGNWTKKHHERVGTAQESDEMGVNTDSANPGLSGTQLISLNFSYFTHKMAKILPTSQQNTCHIIKYSMNSTV